MKAPIELIPFSLLSFDTDTGKPIPKGIENFHFIFTGDVPEGIDRDNIFPGNLKEAQGWAELHDMVATPDPFCIDIWPYPVGSEIRKGLTLGTDHLGNVHYFYLPEGSIFRAMSLREFADHWGHNYDTLMECIDKEVKEVML